MTPIKAEVGMKIECVDSAGRWYPAVITSITSTGQCYFSCQDGTSYFWLQDANGHLTDDGIYLDPEVMRPAALSVKVANATVRPGDKVVYPGRHGSHLYITFGVVTEIGDGFIKAGKSKITCLHRVAKVEEIPND